MGHARDEGHSLLGVGMSLEQAKDFSGAADAYRRSVELLETAYEVSGMPEELPAKAETLTLLAGVLHRSLEEPEEAIEAYEGAASIYRKLDDARHLRKVLLGIASLRWRVGDLEGSARDYQEALESARGDAAHDDEAAALAGLSVVYRDQGRLKESLRAGQEALRLLGDLNGPQAEAYVLTSLAESHSRLGQHPSARSCLQRSLRVRRKIRDEGGEAGALRELAKVHIDLGEMGRARVCLDEAERIDEALKTRVVSTTIRMDPISRYAAPRKIGELSGREVEVASARPEEFEDRARRLRWLHSYITDERGRKFHFKYEAPSMETVLEDSRRAGLSPARDAVTQVLEPDMFR